MLPIYELVLDQLLQILQWITIIVAKIKVPTKAQACWHTGDQAGRCL